MNEEEVEDYVKTMAAVTKLKHPNIIETYDMYKDKENLYLVMEYWKEGNLFKKITADGVTYTEIHVAEIILRLINVIKDLR